MPSEPASKRPPDEDGDDDLVAYLDGELADAETQAVESNLAVDEEARKKAEKLKKTFDLLDYLPTPDPSPNFASRTLTQISPAVATRSEPIAPMHSTFGQPSLPAQPTAMGLSAARPPSRSVGWMAAVWFFGPLLAATLGYVGHLLARPHLEAVAPAKRTSEQVRLLERLPLLLGVDDFEFLKQLDHTDFFGEPDHDDSYKASVETLTSVELEQLENLFKRYPATRQQQLRKLDEDLSQQDPERQTNLLGVLERYAVWLDRLPDAYRKEVILAPAAVERLETIRLVKSRLWREGLPATVRDRVQEAEGPAREQLIAERKQQDAKRRLVWEVAKKEWANIRTDRRPWPFDNTDLTKQVEDYVDKVLKPRLNNAERNDLDSLRKELTMNADWFKWYLYGISLTRFVEQHPMYPEAAAVKVVKRADDLPKPFMNQLVKNGGPVRRQLNNHPGSGKWPDFAEAVLREAHELKVPIPVSVVLGPNKLSEYQPTVREFVEQDLARKLTKQERDELTKAESGSWPDHSKKVIDLARKYDLSVPGVTLPGEPSKWDQFYRNRFNNKR